MKLFVGKWMTLGIIMLSETSQPQKDKYDTRFSFVMHKGKRGRKQDNKG